MKNSKLVSLFKSNTFKLGMVIMLAAAAVLIVLAMMLGDKAGQFVIQVQNGDLKSSIAITEDLDDDTSLKSSISAEGMSNMTDYSPKHFLQNDYSTLRELTSTAGRSNPYSGSLYVYTFYIKNTSPSGGVGVNVTMTYSHVANHLDEVIRVLTYYETYNVQDPQIYQKQDDLTKLGKDSVEYSEYIIQPTMFTKTSSTYGTVFDNQEIEIGDANDSDNNWVKYSVLMWIEGNDPDTDYYAYYTTDEDGNQKYNNQLYSGSIRFQMEIAVKME